MVKKMLVIALLSFFIKEVKAQVWPSKADNLVLSAPIKNWDEAIPLGNGLMGCLFWGEDNTIRLSLDRGDLWDERTNGPKEWWKTQTYKKGGRMWEAAYQGTTPTKLPAGGVFISMPKTLKVTDFELDKYNAKGIARFNNGGQMEVFVSATNRVIMVRLHQASPNLTEVLDPISVSTRFRGSSAGPDSHSINSLGYPAASNKHEKTSNGEVWWYEQEAAEGLSYGVVCEQRKVGDDIVMAITVATSRDSDDWVNEAKKRCSLALGKQFEGIEKSHLVWWHQFWQQSKIDIPDANVRKYYSFARYLYGAGSRADAPPMPLQGVWSAATGSLPPWKGDYHSDLNTQMTYMAYQTAGNFNEGSSYLNYLWNKREVWRNFAHDFYETPGLSVPGVMSLAGQPLGGWAAYSLSPVMTCWNAHLFYLHWLYTGDDAFLKERAYPWSLEAAQSVYALLKPDSTGILKLPRSSSPEMFGNQYWQPNTNYDIMSMKMHFLAVSEMAGAQGLKEEAKKWKEIAEKLGDYHVNPDGELLIAKDKPLRESHRHLSTLMAVFPFNLLTVEGSSQAQKSIAVSLARPEHTNIKHNEWCGYSWAWMSAMRARVGDAKSAQWHLDVFLKAYLSRNGFHVNQDQTPNAEFGWGGGRPFTLEGNFIAMQAIHEMLLQSWSPTPGTPNTGIIRIFPATPESWGDASFTDLRAEGGYKVSAKRKNHQLTWLSITAAGKSGIVRIKNNFGSNKPQWTKKNVSLKGDTYEVNLLKGEKLEAVFN